MVADLRKMQENQGFSEIWIDKFQFVGVTVYGRQNRQGYMDNADP